MILTAGKSHLNRRGTILAIAYKVGGFPLMIVVDQYRADLSTLSRLNLTGTITTCNCISKLRS